MSMPPPPPPPPPPSTPGPNPTPGPAGGPLVPVGIWPRLGARIIDGIVLLIPNGILGVMLLEDATEAGAAQVQSGNFLFSVLSTLLVFGYAVWLEASRGQTLGKMAVGIKTIGPDGGVPSPEVAAKRNVWLLLSIVPVVGGVLNFVAAVAIAVTISGDPFNRGTHDNFAGGSAVVRTR